MTTALFNTIAIVGISVVTWKYGPSCLTKLGRVRWIEALALVIAVACPSVSLATTLTVISPRTAPIFDPGATLDLLAYSEFTDVNGVTVKNKTATDPVVPGATIKPATDKVTVPKAGFSPVVGFTGLKPKPAARRTVDSDSSGSFAGFDGRITYIPPADAMMPSKNGILYASAAHSIVVPGTGQGFSAIRGVDPDNLPSGTYDYAVVIDLMSLDITPGDFGYVSLFATDSRFTDLLWVLDVIATVPTPSSNLILDVSFLSNPVLGLANTAIQNKVKSDLLSSSGTLSNYSLFHTTYDVSVSTVYGEGVEAIVGTPIPEPSTLAMATCGGLFGLVVCWCRKLNTYFKTIFFCNKVRIFLQLHMRQVPAIRFFRNHRSMAAYST